MAVQGSQTQTQGTIQRTATASLVLDSSRWNAPWEELPVARGNHPGLPSRSAADPAVQHLLDFACAHRGISARMTVGGGGAEALRGGPAAGGPAAGGQRWCLGGA